MPRLFKDKTLRDKLQSFSIDNLEQKLSIVQQWLTAYTSKELMQFFEKHKAELLELASRIEATDREIDEIVFALYEISDEERKMILNNSTLK